MVKCWSRNYYKMRLNTLIITGLQSLNLEMDNIPISPDFKFLTKNIHSKYMFHINITFNSPIVDCTLGGGVTCCCCVCCWIGCAWAPENKIYLFSGESS